MTRLSSNGSGRHRVSVSELVREAMRAMHRKANEAGRGALFIQSLRAMNERLTEEPTTFGEPLYRLPALQLTVRQAAILPVVVVFAVHDLQPVVFVRAFKLLS